MFKNRGMQVLKMQLWYWLLRLWVWVCIAYLLALPPTTACWQRREEVCAVIWTMPYTVITLGKSTEEKEIDPREMPPGTKVWIYLRHSPGDNQTIESQEAAVMQLVKEKRWNADKTFRDRWVSGKSTKNRDAFEWMIHLARQNPRPADLLIIWSFDRFARKQLHSQFYKAELRLNGWQILSMTDQVPPGEMGFLYEALKDWMNERFLIDLRANTIRGLRYIVEQGCLPGGQLCKGYTFQEIPIGTYHNGSPRMGRKPQSDPAIAPLVVKAFEMRARGAPYAAISRETGLYGPQPGSWNHLFRNRAYIGEYEFQGEIFTNVYPAIISKELFEAVQRNLPKRQSKMQGRYHPRRRGSSYFLANIAVCACCGGKMEGKSSAGNRYYVCAQSNRGEGSCPDTNLVPADAVENGVLQALREHVLAVDYLESLLDWTNQCLRSGLEELTLQLQKVRSEFEQEEQLLLKMTHNFGTMDTPTRSAQIVLLEQEARVEELRARLSLLEEAFANSEIKTSREEIKVYVQNMRNMISRAEFFDLREICERLCSRIVMGREECRVELHFPAI